MASKPTFQKTRIRGRPRAKCFTTRTAKQSKEEEKMINGYVRREEFHKLTDAEAKAFILFLIMEADRHREDIINIESDILYIRRIRKNG